MPYFLSPIITPDMPGYWSEGSAYQASAIYCLNNPAHPPVNYAEHRLRPHSMPHMEAPAHTQADGKTVSDYFPNHQHYFYGDVLVVKLSGAHWVNCSDTPEKYVWEVTLEQLKQGIFDAQGHHDIPNKILLSCETLPMLDNGLHNPDYVLVLSQASADYLLSNPDFHLYGTSWISSDYQPNRRERPIHNTLFKQAVIFEYLLLNHVPAGCYYFVGFPLPLQGASESVACPVLFTRDELTHY